MKIEEISDDDQSQPLSVSEFRKSATNSTSFNNKNTNLKRKELFEIEDTRSKIKKGKRIWMDGKFPDTRDKAESVSLKEQSELDLGAIVLKSHMSITEVGVVKTENREKEWCLQNQGVYKCQSLGHINTKG